METKKLVLKKETIAALEKNEELNIVGGTGASCAAVGCGAGIDTRGQCDIPTIGHDDGKYCLSKSDWGWCWCFGQ